MHAWLKTFRWLNLLILAATQYLTLYFVIRPIMLINDVDIQIGHFTFVFFVLANVFVVAAGYLINDYYDVKTDAINRPGTNMLEEHIKPKTAYFIYFLLNGLGMLSGFYCSFKVGSLKLGFLFLIVAIVLYFYSLKYKRQVVSGNLAIAFLAAYMVIAVWLFEFFAIKNQPVAFASLIGSYKTITFWVGGLAIFAFLVTLIREMIKDAEDVEGDKQEGCNTLAVKYGISATKKILLWITVFTMFLLALAQVFLFKNFPLLSSYFFVIQGMFIYFLLRLSKAQHKEDFHYLSTLLKIIMVAGLVSTQVFYISI